MWVLLSTANDYNQHGEYFEGWWKEKPTLERFLQDFPALEHCAEELLEKEVYDYGFTSYELTFVTEGAY